MGVCASKKPQPDLDFDKDLIKSNADLPLVVSPEILDFTTPIYLETVELTVCEAIHVPSNKPVIIKRHLKIKKTLKRIKNEIEVLSHVNHPSITKLIDHIETADSYFLIYEKFDGIPVLDYCAKYPDKLSQGLVRHIIRQLVDALAFIHTNKVLHRNINPHTVLFDGSAICLTGFHHAKKVDSYPLVPIGKNGMKKTWTVVYLRSPESVYGRSNHKAEIWAIGVIAYMLLTGQRLFRATSDQKLRDMISDREIDWTSVDDKNMHPMVVEVLKGLLRKEVDKRVDLELVGNYPWFSDMAGGSDVEVRPDVLRGLLWVSNQSRYHSILKKMVLERKTEGRESDRLRKLFSEFDVKGDGVISRDEAWIAVQKSHVLLNKQDFEGLFRKYDRNKSWTIQYDELIKGVAERRVLMRVDELKGLYRDCDPDKRGYMLLSELEDILGVRMGEQSVRGLFLRYAGKADRVLLDEFLGFSIELVEMA